MKSPIFFEVTILTFGINSYYLGTDSEKSLLNCQCIKLNVQKFNLSLCNNYFTDNLERIKNN